jgi:hypothetical protein
MEAEVVRSMGVPHPRGRLIAIEIFAEQLGLAPDHNSAGTKAIFSLAFGAFGFWPLAFGFWPLAFGLWPLAFGLWPLAFGFWPLAFGFWPLAFGFWPLAFNS